MPFTRETGAAAGRRGGQAVVRRYGREHMARRGSRGAAATLAKLEAAALTEREQLRYVSGFSKLLRRQGYRRAVVEPHEGAVPF